MDLFFSAVENNDLVKAKSLLNSGVNINKVDNYGYSALHIASSKDLLEMALLLINSDIDVNLQDKSGQTVLHYVALNNQLELAKVLLNKGAKLSVTDIHGNQPLWTAVFNDKGRGARIEIIKLFLEYGADFNHINKVGKSPKDIVIIAGYDNLRSLMIDKNA